jgi:GAF domain-containing protein
MKKQRTMTTEPKRRNAPKVARRRGSAAGGLQEKLDLRTRELREALEQQTATADVLKVISRSAFDLNAVFKTVAESSVTLCGADRAIIFRFDGEMLRAAAAFNAPQKLTDWLERNPIQPGRHSVAARAALEHRTIQVTDVLADPEHTYAAKNIESFRTVLGVPILKGDDLLGVILIYHTEVRPFTDKQIALVETFAAQAGIAIENTRLLNELRQSLQQQTATSDVLSVISSSPGELEPVFTAMLENATRICDAKFGTLYRGGEDTFQLVSTHGLPPAIAEDLRRAGPRRPPPNTTALGRVAATKRTAHIADALSELGDLNPPPGFTGPSLVKLAGARTVLGVPMLKQDELVGAIVVYRTEVRPFTDKQIELVQNFAAQAVIAIENTRLLKELRQRTDDLSEALEHQTATTEVLQVINASPGDLAPVFRAILEKAHSRCAAALGTLGMCDGEMWRAVVMHGYPETLAKRLRQGSRISDNPLLRPLLDGAGLVHITDMAGIDHPIARANVEFGIHTLLIVPLRKDGALIGTISAARYEIHSFSDKQIDLLTNFASQAVIAIENTRLLNELTKMNQQLEQRVKDQVGEIERMGRLRRFLPQQVADLIVASGMEKQLESHRREITALFCDLRGFTGFSESSDPEDVMALLREYHAAIGEIIIKYSGTLERYAGDGVMVIFNDPVPVPNPALQAVKMALDMRVTIGALIEKWRRLGHDLGFGIGIAHGFATLGTIGFEGRFDYAAIGTVSNVASRLCDEAKPGQILISPRVLMAVENDVTVEPVGEFTLKGIRRPMSTYNVLAAAAPETSHA